MSVVFPRGSYMAIATAYALGCCYALTKSNTVHERALLRAQQGSVPQTLDLGKRSLTTNAPKILVSVISRVLLLQESGVNGNFKFTSLIIFLGLLKNKVGKCIKSIHICHLSVMTELSAELENICGWANFLNLYLNTRLPTKTIRKLDVNAFREEGKRLSLKFT